MHNSRARWIFLVLCFFVGTSAHADPLKKVAKHLVEGLTAAQLKNSKIAVLSFPYHDGSTSSGSSIISEHLTNLLVDCKGVQVIERSLLSKVLGEMKLEETGITDPASTQKLGKVLGVNAVVTGTLIDLDNGETEVNARLIQTETGEVLAAATTRIDRTWTDLPHPTQEFESEAAANTNNSVTFAQKSPDGQIREESGMIFTPIQRAPNRKMPPPPPPLVLSDEDLKTSPPSEQRPEIFVENIISNPNPSPETMSMVRRIYQRNPDRHLRARALYAMGLMMERQRRPGWAAYAYQQLIREFPYQAEMQELAHSRLAMLHANAPHE